MERQLEYNGFIIIIEGGDRMWAHQIQQGDCIVDDYCFVHRGYFGALDCAIKKKLIKNLHHKSYGKNNNYKTYIRSLPHASMCNYNSNGY
jgi:hypothetical protein